MDIGYVGSLEYEKSAQIQAQAIFLFLLSSFLLSSILYIINKQLLPINLS